MEKLDITERLRGKVRVPVNDGAGLLDGKDFFERSFPTSKAAMEAADEIESLRAQLEAARNALETLIQTAQLLQQNSEGCAVNHHGLDIELNGLPGWLQDTQKHIDEARAVLQKDNQV